MAALDDLDEVIERCQRALDEFVKGNPEPMKAMFSHREDATLANPFGPPARGWEQVAATLDRAASNLRDGAMVAFEEVAKYVSPELAYTVWLERQEAMVGELGAHVLRHLPCGSRWTIDPRMAPGG